MTLAMLAPTAPPDIVYGSPVPRVAPPLPLHSDLEGFRRVALEIGITPMPWQETAASYLEGLAPDGRHLFQEVAIVVARQNGKTTELVPLIVKRLRAGRRIMHTAQNRDLPREVFGMVADIISQDQSLFPERNGRAIRPRFANGQEEIKLANGGHYRIVAPTRSGARGGTNDDVIVDELREMETFDFIAAAKPTMTTSPDPQIIYLSNAGEEDSLVLNSVRDRADKDTRLAYLEWSAAPGRESSDRIGWAEANPALGHIPTMWEYLEGEYRTNFLQRTLAIFETEHLCRWVLTLRPPIVADALFAAGEAPDLEATPRRACLGIAMDPSGSRASAAVAWPRPDGSLGLRLLFDVTGEPIDVHRLGRDMRLEARKLGVGKVGFDPATDAMLAKFFTQTESISGQKHANASAQFVSSVEAGRVRWQDAEAVGLDLPWVTRKEHDETGTFQAVRAQDDRPITAALAAIRALWLASTPRPEAGTTPRRGAVGF